MDKKQLNMEIVLCRSLMKKARVFAIRRLLKQIKILRSCKNEKLKEKKFRKARRLVAEIHIMKTLRPDYVTKFALLTEHYVPAGSNTKLKRKRNACAKIVKHKDVIAKINDIRNKFANWKEEIPTLLISAKKKKVMEPATDEAEIENGLVSDDSEESENEINTSISDEEEEESSVNKSKEDTTKVKKSNSDSSEPKVMPKSTNPKKDPTVNVVPAPVFKFNNVKTIKKSEVAERAKPERKLKKTSRRGGKGRTDKEEKGEAEVREKIDDPFFIGKKIVVPKLLQKGNENHPENENTRKRAGTEELQEETNPKKNMNVIDEREDGRAQKEKRSEKWAQRKKEPVIQDELHPSWKAKKMHTIKPFLGKIIRFE